MRRGAPLSRKPSSQSQLTQPCQPPAGARLGHAAPSPVRISSLNPPPLSSEFPSVPSRFLLPLSGPSLSPFPPEVPPHPRTPRSHSGAKCPAVCPLSSHARLRGGLPSSPCASGSGQPRTLGLGWSWRPPARTHLPQWDPADGGRAPGLGFWTLGWPGRRAWGGRQCRATGRWRQRTREARLALPGWGEEAAANEAERRPLPAWRLPGWRRRRSARGPGPTRARASGRASASPRPRSLGPLVRTRQEKPFVS